LSISSLLSAYWDGTKSRNGFLPKDRNLAGDPNVAPDIVIGGNRGRGAGNDCGAAANGVSLIASVNSARRPCRPWHSGSRPREKSVNAGAPRGNALFAETFRALGLLG
jgi:hypothetical protein